MSIPIGSIDRVRPHYLFGFGTDFERYMYIKSVTCIFSDLYSIFLFSQSLLVYQFVWKSSVVFIERKSARLELQTFKVNLWPRFGRWTIMLTSNLLPDQNRNDFLQILDEKTVSSLKYPVTVRRCNEKVKLGIIDNNLRRSPWMPEYLVVRREVHADYDGKHLHDIAVYKLHVEVRFTQFIRPACLVTGYQHTATKGIFIGNNM